MKKNYEKDFMKLLNISFPIKIDIYYFLKFLLNKKYFYDMIKNKKKQKLKEILKNLYIKEMNSNEIVFYEGEPSNEFYLILKGSIDIYKKFTNSDNLKKLKDTNELEYKNIIFNKFSNNFYENFKNNRKLYNKDKENFDLIKVISLNEGNHFGELGIINDQKRKATIITLKSEKFIENKYLNYINDYEFQIFIELITKKYKNKIIFACLKKEIFKKFIKDEFIEEQNKKIYRFNNIFQNLFIKENIFKILPYFHKKEYYLRNLICKKNEKFNKIFIIDKGKIELLDIIKIKKLNNNKNDNYLNYLKLKLKKEIFLDDKNFEVNVRYLKKNDFIGLYELSKNLDNFFFSAKVKSKKLIVYEISLENVEFLNNNIFKFNKIFLKFLINFKEYIKRKNNLIFQWKKNINTINIKSLYNSNNLNKTKININNNLLSKIDHIKYFQKKISLINKNNNLIIGNLGKENIKKNYKKENNLMNNSKSLRLSNLNKKTNIFSKTNNFLKSINSNVFINKRKKINSKINFNLKKNYLLISDKRDNQILSIKNSNVNGFKNYFHKNKYKSLEKIKNKFK